MKYVLFFVFVAAGVIFGFSLAEADYHLAPTEPSGAPAALPNSSAQAPVGASPTPSPCVASYTCSVVAGATIVPGTMDIGNHTDDGVTFVTLPFPFTLYGASYNGVNLSSNGNAQFVSSDDQFNNVCLPYVVMGPTIFAYWEDLDTEGTTCTGGCGIYTSISGSAPNRIFNIEWRTFYFSEPGNAYFEIRLYEATSDFDVILGQVNTTATGTIGVQDGAARFTQCICNTQPPTNSRIVFTANSGLCGTVTSTVTPGGATMTPTRTATRTSTIAPTSTTTSTPTPLPTQTPGGPPATPISSDTPTHTPGPGGGTNTPRATVTSTTCPLQFSDVPDPSTFYAFIRCLACRGIVNGYSDGMFRPNNNVTRGQLSKIVSNSAGFSDPQTTQMFEDVAPGSTFFDHIGRLASRGYISGYPCGGTGEPCVPPANLPYFRTNNNATRGQITKIVSNAAGFTDPPAGQIFEDVPPGSTFYSDTQRLASRGVMQGYPCGGVGEPCNPPLNRPYFRTFNNATRGQTSKIVANTFFPDCETPRHW